MWFVKVTCQKRCAQQWGQASQSSRECTPIPISSLPSASPILVCWYSMVRRHMTLNKNTQPDQSLTPLMFLRNLLQHHLRDLSNRRFKATLLRMCGAKLPNLKWLAVRQQEKESIPICSGFLYRYMLGHVNRWQWFVKEPMITVSEFDANGCQMFLTFQICVRSGMVYWKPYAKEKQHNIRNIICTTHIWSPFAVK